MNVFRSAAIKLQTLVLLRQLRTTDKSKIRSWFHWNCI